MAGHHKWSNVKRLIGALDAKRGKLLSKFAGEISVAARTGGGSPDAHPCLRRKALGGNVAFQFYHYQFVNARTVATDTQVMETAFSASADDISADREHRCSALADALPAAGFEPNAVQRTYIPENHVTINEDPIAAQFLRLSDALEANDDFQHTHTTAAPAANILLRIDG